jgi:hypothetical protein
MIDDFNIIYFQLGIKFQNQSTISSYIIIIIYFSDENMMKIDFFDYVFVKLIYCKTPLHSV